MMNKTLIILSLTLLASCGPSSEEIRQAEMEQQRIEQEANKKLAQEKANRIAAVTCSIMGETKNIDGAIRVREINDAREKIGGEPFLSGDDAIKEAFGYGICEELVLNENYNEIIKPLRDATQERERIAAEKRAEEAAQERERIAAEKRAEENRIAEEKQSIAESIAAEKRRIAAEKKRVAEEKLAQEARDYRLAVTEDEKAMAQIQREIIQSWPRPPSARNGMQVLLTVFLVPTGEVVDVMLKTSSGNDALDRSAMLAVRKAERFIVPTNSAQFEKDFRALEIVMTVTGMRL